MNFEPAFARHRGILPGWAWMLVVTVAAWLIAWRVFNGLFRLPLQAAQVTPLHLWLNSVNDWVGNNRDSNLLFALVFDTILNAVHWLASVFIHLFVHTDVGLQLPLIGWVGVVALVTWLAAALANYKVAILTAVGFAMFGMLGVFTDAMWTFSLTMSAVIICVLIGIPLGIWAGVNSRVNSVVVPMLDFMQTLPSFVYLAPLALLFLIGPAAAVIATVIYAAPPIIRLTAHGIRDVSPAISEAANSLGIDSRQRLRMVLLPVARRSIIVGLNQTVMAALSMVTIAALIAAPGLGQLVVRSLQSLNVGNAFVSGFAIVILAIVLDRVTTAASRRAEISARESNPSKRRHRLIALTGGLFVVIGAIVVSRNALWAATFPDSVGFGPLLSTVINDLTNWIQTTFSVVTTGLKNGFSYGVINPFQSLFTGSPYFVIAIVILVIAAVVGGRRAAITSAVCLGLIIATGLWQDAMVTLASTIIATIATMILALMGGVAMGRSSRVDRWLRPILDAAQTMPAFVYLIPFLGLFGPSRFTAIVAAVIYSAPVAIKIIAEGISGVAPETVEAAESTGSSPWQMVFKVQVPMAKASIALAANQGLIYVLSMVVIGGLVGGGALGYDVVAGFSQGSLFGKGLAAGIAIVLLGIMLDRITQAAATSTPHKAPRIRRMRAKPAPLTATPAS